MLPWRTLTTGIQTYTICSKNPNKLGYYALLSTQNCSGCFDGYNGVIVYKDNATLPRLMCSAIRSFDIPIPKIREFYVFCKKLHRSVRCEKYCKNCESYLGFEASTLSVKCALSTKERNVRLIDAKTPNIDFPYPISCPEKRTVDIYNCLQCQHFKGVMNDYKFRMGQVCCAHPNAKVDIHITCAVKPKPKKNTVHSQREQKSNAKPCWYNEEYTHPVKINVSCSSHKSLSECKKCENYRGLLPKSRIDCSVFTRKPMIEVMCPHQGDAEKYPVALPVSLTVCKKCKAHMKIDECEEESKIVEVVQCNWTRRLIHVTREPRKILLL